MKIKPLVPLLPVFLVLAWLVLNDSYGPGQALLGIVFALVISWATARLRPLPAWPRRGFVILRLLFQVIWDVARSNLAVTWLILGPSRQLNGGFMRVPLQLRDPHGLAILSAILTATPGTVWSDHHPASGVATIHVLDLEDEVEWLQMIKHRYEHPLMEIFEMEIFE